MNKRSLHFGWRRISQSQVRNLRPWEVSQLKGRVTGMQSSCNLQRTQTRLAHTKERLCVIHLVSTVFPVPALMILGKTVHYSRVNFTADLPSSYASRLMEPLCPFVDFLREFLACVPELYLLWSLYPIIASFVKGVKCIYHSSLPTHTQITSNVRWHVWLLQMDGGCLLGWMVCLTDSFLASLSINFFLGLLFFWLCASANIPTIPWALLLSSMVDFQWPCF